MNSLWRIIDLENTPNGDIGKIKAVKRLKDDQVFTVGQVTPHGTIREFTIHQGSIHVYMLGYRMNGYDGPTRSEIVSLEHLRV